MYGFVEKWLADMVGVDYEPFQLNNGSYAAMIDQRPFNRIKNALSNMWQEG